MSFILESHYGYNFESVSTNWEDVQRTWADSAFFSDSTSTSSLVTEPTRPSNNDFSSVSTDWESFSRVWDSMVGTAESELIQAFTGEYARPSSNFYENTDSNWEDTTYTFESGAFSIEPKISDTILTTSTIYTELGVIDTIDYFFNTWDLFINQDEVIYSEGVEIPVGGIDLVTAFEFNNISENWDSFSHDWESLYLNVETLATSSQIIESISTRKWNNEDTLWEDILVNWSSLELVKEDSIDTRFRTEEIDFLNMFHGLSSNWESVDREWDNYMLGVE